MVAPSPRDSFSPAMTVSRGTLRSVASICRRHLHRIDHQDFIRRPLRHDPQTELLADRVLKHWRVDLLPRATEPDRPLIVPRQPSFVHNWSIKLCVHLANHGGHGSGTAKNPNTACQFASRDAA